MTTPHEPTLVSIIVNNYNYGAYLRQAIESALDQSWQPVEVIVVDDGSTDNSREIIYAFREAVTGIIKPNEGQASAFNAGFGVSRGDLVIFLDSDDVLRPDAVAQVVQAFREHPDAAKIEYRMEVIDAAGMATGEIVPAEHLAFSRGDLRSHVLAFPFDLTWMATSGNAFPAWVLRRIFPVPSADYRILADFYLAHLTPLFGPVVALDRVGASYRVHGRNAFARASRTLDMAHIRQMITFARMTECYIKQYARELGLETEANDPEAMLSVSTVAERLISVKLEPEQHPIQGDSVGRLFRLGLRAALRRFDASAPLKLVFALWFAAMTVAPQAQSRWLAEKFYFPESRSQFNRLLAALHRI